MLYGHIEALHADDPSLGVEPAADNNVMKATESCLFMRTASGSMYGGRRSMSWWATTGGAGILFCTLLMQMGSYRHEVLNNGFTDSFLSFYFMYWDFSFGVAAMCFIGCFWMYIPWRRQLPIIFNRRTNKVTCLIDGQIVSEDWGSIDFYIKDATTAAAGGTPINEGVLTLAFHHWGLSGKRLHAVILGTQDVHAAMVSRGIYGAAMTWEYIRLYMREGSAAVPPITPIADYRLKRLTDPFRHFNPLKCLDVKFWWYPVAIPFFVFVALPLAPVAIIGDLLYYALDRALPRRKWPQELIDACDGIWDGRE
ncbi:DUF6708 domain-containing protein [Pseudomonas protegens]|uniref:DUF6708 domain-containing protein n=1 Tax=Pseudomonas protegens TaxID=380021 RepID=UPI001F312667|nr:DUF6708 domain-containing protein [Pseudomonas protegens]